MEQKAHFFALDLPFSDACFVRAYPAAVSEAWVDAVFVKEVVRRFHAASLISGAPVSFSGFSQTGPAGFQLRILPDQRFGFCARAFA